MPTFDEEKQRYMVTEAGGGTFGSSASPILIYPGCSVVPRIHAQRYFPALKAAIDSTGGPGSFIYITGWWFSANFSLEGPTGGRLVDLLIAKAQAGVDVRVLGWVVAPEVMQSSLLRRAISSAPGLLRGATGLLQQNEDTMNFIQALRNEPALADKAVLNTLSHPAGSVHLKFALVGDGSQVTGFTGGLDLRPDRWSPNWHDVQAEVKGPVCQEFFETFRTMWNEVRRRPKESMTALTVTMDNRTDRMPDLPQRPAAGTTGSRHHAQSLRTLPQFNFTLAANQFLPTNDPLNYAPSGLFEIKAAWQKGISGATSYIYIEDQGFSSLEVLRWANAAVRADPGVRVILVTGMPDPNDAPNKILPKLFSIAVNDSLLADLDAAQMDRVRVFKHKNRIIHSKTTIVDDKWSILGSANATRRSLYTDFEHSVAFMDEDHRAVAAYRTDLWNEHLGQSLPDLAAGLAAWFAVPFAGSGAPGTAQVVRLRLPLTSVTLSENEQVLYDQVYDVDSTKDWGPSLWQLFSSLGNVTQLLSP